MCPSLRPTRCNTFGNSDAHYLRSCALAAVLLSSLIVSSCGGGGGSSGSGGGSGGGQPIPPGDDFTLQLFPTSIALVPGQSVSAGVGITPGFPADVSVQITGLPTGVSASPLSFTLYASGGLQTVTFSAVANAPVTSGNVLFTGTAASLDHSSDMALAVVPPLAATLSTRTKYVRTDAVIEYWQWVNSHWEVLHSPTSRIFVTDPGSNRIFVFDSTSETEIATILVPGAYAIDETADQSTLYVGTLIGDVYTIDPVAMSVTRRYVASEIGPYGYEAIAALPLADGSVALLAKAGGIPAVDGSSSIAIWNPASNSISVYGGFGAGPSSPLCGDLLGAIFGFSLTPDRESILVSGEEPGSGVCEMNATTGNYITAIPVGDPLHLVLSPDGRYLAFPVYPGGAAIYDATTLTLLNQFSVVGDTSTAAGFIFSADSQTLFVPNGGFLQAYNVASGQLIGWLPQPLLANTSSGFAVGPVWTPNYEAEDSTGLLMGPLEEGMGFVDTTTLRTGPTGVTVETPGAGFLSPATGPSSGGTFVSETTPQSPSVDVTAMYFGSQAAANPSNNSGTFSATTPPGAPGPVPVYTFMADGSMQLTPDGFSYGPSILEVTPNLATADGGGAGVLYGYGFGPVGTSSAGSTLPGDVTVAVEGSSAQIAGANLNSTYYEIPFLLQSLDYVIPPGLASSTVDVAVTTSSGTVVAKSSLAYLPPTQQFPLPGSALAQGVFDPVRDLYYFTDATNIQVFSLAEHQWISAIPIAGAKRLWGIALSPDSSKLAVTDEMTNTIYLVDPANTSSVSAFAVPIPQGSATGPTPYGIAVGNSGFAYVVTSSLVFELDTSSGTFTAYPVQVSSNSLSPPQYQRIEISSDGSRVYFDTLGRIFYIDTATNSLSSNTGNEIACCNTSSDITLSASGGTVGASLYFYDADLNAESFLTQNDREVQNISYLYGAKLSPDGSLFFQPSTNGIDVYDGRLGVLLDRVALPFALSQNYDALVSDQSDDMLIAITGATGDGIAVVDLTSISEPSPLPYAEARRPTLFRNAAAAKSSAPAKKSQVGASPHPIPYVTRPIPLRTQLDSRH
jgi:hypothetical protein